MAITIVVREKHLWLIPEEGAPVDLIEAPRLSTVLLSLRERGGSARPLELKAATSPKAPHYRSLTRLKDLGLVTIEQLGGEGEGNARKGRPVAVYLTEAGEQAADAIRQARDTV